MNTDISPSKQAALLNEIFIQPSHTILIDRFMTQEESTAGRCNGACRPDMCVFST